MRAPLRFVRFCALVSMPAIAIASQGTWEVAQRWSAHRARWDWALDRPPSRLSVSLARGDVKVVRWKRDRVEMHATSPDPEDDGSAAAIVVSNDGRGLRIIDRYPPLPLGGRRECYPPDDEHGGAWVYQDRVSITLFVPYGMEISQSGE